MMEVDVRDTRWAQLRDLCEMLVSHRRLILASNRGPVEHYITTDGRAEARRGTGGVVTALSALSQMVEFVWVASAMSEGDRKTAQDAQNCRFKSPLPGHRIYLRFVVTPRRVYHKYYNIFCNPLLWFLQHYMWNSPYNPNVDANIHDAWNDGYTIVNEAFAQAIAEEAGDSLEPPIVLVHDYHLYLIPAFIRKSLPNSVIQHFTHIPWPTPRYWQLLPYYMRRSICEGLCSANIVGFQTLLDVRNFLDSCEEFLPGAKIDHENKLVYWNGQRVLVRAYPLSINVAEIKRIASSPRVLDYERKLQPLCNEKTIVRIDRAEPSKNVVRGFKAFGLLLSRYPEFRGKVNFLAFLVPSRTHIKQYQRYMDEIHQAIQEINANFGSSEWQPITTFFENNYTQAVAGMKLYDVLLVNSVIDGMNLVAKEGPVVNTRAGVLVLSESTGAHKQLCQGALSVAPADVEGTMQALYQALMMSLQEREQRANILTQNIEREDVNHWLYSQMEEIKKLVIS